MKHIALYNPLAGNGQYEEYIAGLKAMYPDLELQDITKITDFGALFAGLDAEDAVIVCGGDGTLTRFADAVRHIPLEQNIYYYAIGSGNDFLRDLGLEKGAAPTFPINRYITNLPTVTVNGSEHVFVNGVGYGIDGYCCEVGDELRTVSDKPVNYTMIAIKGLLFHYKPTNATVTVDGKEYKFKKVWLAPTMNGRYYGGGMMPTPEQDRLGEDKQLSLLVFHDTGKLQTLCIFPSLFKGEHVKHTNAVTILTGKEISVEFDRPAPLQIDGETVLNVTKYTAKAAAPVNEKA